jgi:hypothetical protein
VKQLDLEPDEWSVVRHEDIPAERRRVREPIIAPGGWGVLSFWFCFLAIMWLAAQIIGPLVRTYFAGPVSSLLCETFQDCRTEAQAAADPAPGIAPRPSE